VLRARQSVVVLEGRNLVTCWGPRRACRRAAPAHLRDGGGGLQPPVRAAVLATLTLRADPALNFVVRTLFDCARR
jgi:hypothetical protein